MLYSLNQHRSHGPIFVYYFFPLKQIVMCFITLLYFVYFVYVQFLEEQGHSIVTCIYMHRCLLFKHFVIIRSRNNTFSNKACLLLQEFVKNSHEALKNLERSRAEKEAPNENTELNERSPKKKY